MSLLLIRWIITIRQITPSGIVTTLAGNPTTGFVNGAFKNAKFFNPSDLLFDLESALIISDNQNNVLRKMNFSSNQVISIPGTSSPANSVSNPNINLVWSFARSLCLTKEWNFVVGNFWNFLLHAVNRTGFAWPLASGIGLEDGSKSKFYFPMGPMLIPIDCCHSWY